VSAVYQPDRGVIAKLRRRMRYALARRPDRCAPQRGTLTLCFDDFPKSAAEDGAAALERFGARGTFFASGGFAGGEGPAGAMFDAGDLVRLARSGHEIGCHTFSHLDCARVSPGEALADIDRNARALAAMGVEQPLASFAFPYGEASAAAKRAVAARFPAIRGVRADLNRGGCDSALLKAACIDGGEARVERALVLLAAAARRPAWVILFAHGVARVEDDLACTPGQIARCLRAARALGLDIRTFGDGAAACLRPQAARRGADSALTTSPAASPPRASTSSARA